MSIHPPGPENSAVAQSEQRGGESRSVGGPARLRRGDPSDDSRYVSLTTGPWKHRLPKIERAEHWGVLLGRALAIIAATRRCTCDRPQSGHTERCLLLRAAELEAEAAAAGITPHIEDLGQ